MLVYSKLGKKGNLGNQLFQIASTIGIATKNAHKFAFPEWEYSNCFVCDFPLYNPKLTFISLKEKSYQYYDLKLDDGNYDLNGWFQSEKYFNIELVKTYFKFKPELIDKVREKNKNVLSKNNILISIRRGDFVNHPYYYQLDYKYYFLAITSQFPDWKERNLIFTSDDINYCKRHFQFLQNAIFIEKTDVTDQLILASLCDDFVISNSTFSWWQAWLGEKETNKIIRPIQNFRGKFKSENNDNDYFPNRWVVFNPKKESIELRYWKLILKGELLKIIVKNKYFYLVVIRKIKILLKKIYF